MDATPEINPILRPVHVVASPHKTATSSVADALVALDVGKKPMPYRGQLLRDSRAAIDETSDLVKADIDFDAFYMQHAAGIFEKLADMIEKVRPFDVFHDAPVGHSHLHPFVLKTIMPKAKFIWVKRPVKAWLKSVQNWEQTHPDTYKRHAEWDTDPDSAVKRSLKRRRRARHGFDMIAKAFPADTLILEWNDMGSFDKMASFYGVPIPETPFPHSNKS